MRISAVIVSFLIVVTVSAVLASNPMFRLLPGAGAGPTATPTPTPSGSTITTSGSWVVIGGTTSTIASATRTLTGTGTIKFVFTTSGGVPKYSKNGAAFVTMTNGGTLAVAQSDRSGAGTSLQIEITGTVSGGGISGTVQDNSNSATVGTINIHNDS